jgi:hypothetical protein
MDGDPYRNAITEALIMQHYGQPGAAVPAPYLSMPPIPDPQRLPSYISKGAGSDPSIPPSVRMPQPVDEPPPGYYR